MLPARYWVYVWAGAFIAINWLSVTITPPKETILLGYFLGSLSASATLAAAWSALGPGPVIWRLPLSIAWVCMLLVAVGINISINSGPSNGVFVVGTWLFVQWLLLQLPLWTLNAGLGFHLRYHEDANAESDAASVRFGLRDLLITMAIVGVLLGIIRALVSGVQMASGSELPIFIFLGVAGMIMTFPLVVAPLMQRMALPGVALAILFMCAATYGELISFEQIAGPGPSIEDFIAINATSAIVILLVAGVVRLSGYSLRKKSQPMNL